MTFWRRVSGSRSSQAGVVFVSGGEPREGCDPVALLLVAVTSAEALSRASGLGVWDPAALGDIQIPTGDVQRALADRQGFLWKPGRERAWRASDTWPAGP